ncbi:hypothetical protein ACVMFA_002109 [Bradyrhizobium liaoningense]
MHTMRSVVGRTLPCTGGGMMASAVSFFSIARRSARGRTRARAADFTASRSRVEHSSSACRVSIFGFGTMSTAPASNASNITFEPSSVNEEQMITGIGRCAMILRRKVMPSMRGISRSRMMTSGSSFSSRLAATNGSDAVAITSISGSSLKIVSRIWRTDAESSTISTRTFSLGILVALRLDLENGWLNLLQPRHGTVNIDSECPTSR